MATKEQPARRFIDHDGGGSQTTTVTTRDTSNNVPDDVHRMEVQSIYAFDTSAGANTIVLEDFDGSSVVRQVSLELASGDEDSRGEDSEKAIFDVPSGHEMRVTSDGDAEITLELVDVRL